MYTTESEIVSSAGNINDLSHKIQRGSHHFHRHETNKFLVVWEVFPLWGPILVTGLFWNLSIFWNILSFVVSTWNFYISFSQRLANNLFTSRVYSWFCLRFWKELFLVFNECFARHRLHWVFSKTKTLLIFDECVGLDPSFFLSFASDLAFIYCDYTTNVWNSFRLHYLLFVSDFEIICFYIQLMFWNGFSVPFTLNWHLQFQTSNTAA